MGYNTALTEWPSVPIPDAVKSHIDMFFSIMDTNAAGMGDRLAEEIFAEDGVIDGRHKAEGTEAIRRSRDHAWDTIASRRHEILKVYTDGTESKDLLVLGQVTIGYKTTGETKRGEFIARMKIADSQTTHPRLSMYKVWMDTSTMTKV